MANEVCEDCGTRCAVGVPRCPQCSSTRLVPEEVLAGLMPSLTVCCLNDECPALGIERRVGLPQVVPGVLVLPRLVCAKCGFELLKVTEDIVPKITVHGGPSNAAAEPDSVPVEETPEGEQPAQADADSSDDGGETETSREPADKATQPRSRTTRSSTKKTRGE